MNTQNTTRNDGNLQHSRQTCDAEAARVDELAKEILQDRYVSFTPQHIDVAEDFISNTVRVTARLLRGSGDLIEVAGQGVGVVDAFFDGMMRAFAQEFPSLKTMAVADFRLETGFDKAKGRRSDATAAATLQVRNTEGAHFEFMSATPSITRSSILAVLQALTFFINSEKAYLTMHLALTDAKSRRRQDLVQKYQSQMAILVHATSYSELIERVKNQG